jgi:hypothetical protein
MAKPDTNNEKREAIITAIGNVVKTWRDGIYSADTVRIRVEEILKDCGQTRKDGWNRQVGMLQLGIAGKAIDQDGTFIITDENLDWFLTQHALIGLSWEL